MANPSDEATPQPSPSDSSLTSPGPSAPGIPAADLTDSGSGRSVPRGTGDAPFPPEDPAAIEPGSSTPAGPHQVIAEPGPTPNKHTLAGPGTATDPYREDPYEADYNHDDYDHGHRRGWEGADTSESHHDPRQADHGDHDHHGPHDGEATDERPWDEEEEGGGPVKSFLEHLEDFRWVIIRCLASLAIGMVICLVAGPTIVRLLKEPLEEAQRLVQRPDRPMVMMESGTNRWVLNLPSPHFGSIDMGSNQAIKLILAPVQVGTNTVLGLTPVPLNPDELPPSNKITLKNLGPLSGFVVAMKIALFGGIGLASPFILLFIGHFIVPALRRKEKHYLYRAVAIGSVLFMSGVVFCYVFMLKVALNASVKFSEWMSFEADIWRAEDYISFVVKFMLGMGLSFELPVVLLTLVKLDLIDYPRMVKFRPYWVVVNMVLAAILTPPDPFSMMLMAIPMQILFEISVLIARSWWKKDPRRLEEAAAQAASHL